MKKRHNYQKKIMEMVNENKIVAIPGTVSILHIYHDGWCNFFKCGTCNCHPNFEQEWPNLSKSQREVLK